MRCLVFSQQNSSLATKIEITHERYEHTSTTIAANSAVTITLALTEKDGYNPIAAFCDVTGANAACPTACSVHDSIIELRLRNDSSSSITTNAEWITIFWKKA